MFRLTSCLAVLVVLFGVGHVSADAVLRTHHYTFDLDASDSAGTNDGTLMNGASIVLDPVRGNVLDLDGMNDYVNLQYSNIPGGPTNTSVFTIAAWINVPPGWDGYQHDGGLYNESNTGTWAHKNHFVIENDNGKLSFDQYPSAGGNIRNSRIVVDDTWHHVAYVQNEPGSSNRKIYVDGVLDVFDDSPEAYRGPAPDTWTIGARLGTGTAGLPKFTKGRIDDLRFYDVALTAEQIQILTGTPTLSVLWDEQGDGNWRDLDPQTELSRWVDSLGTPGGMLPKADSHVVVRTDTVTVAADREAARLVVESGEALISEQATLTLSGSVDVESDGSITLSRDATLVADDVTVSGSIGGSDATVYSDVTVNGKLVVNDPAALLIVDGDLTFAPNAVLELAVDRRQAARVDSTGEVKLEANSVLHLSADGASPFTAGTYTLLTADEALTGRFATSSGLGRYVSIGPDVDGLAYTGTTLTVTIDEDLNLGDANLSGRTDLSDFNIWNANKFATGTGWTAGDFNGDGTTDLSDFNIWNANKFTVANGGAAPAPTEVPEPGTLLLLAVGVAITLAYWRQRRVLPRSG